MNMKLNSHVNVGHNNVLEATLTLMSMRNNVWTTLIFNPRYISRRLLPLSGTAMFLVQFNGIYERKHLNFGAMRVVRCFVLIMNELLSYNKKCFIQILL